MAKSRKSKGKGVELAVATTSLIDSSKGDGGGNADTTGVTLVPQIHGGALNSGGTPGNEGGTAPTPQALRALMRHPLTKLLPVVTAIAEAQEVEEVTCPHCEEKHDVPTYRKAGDRLKAVDLLARYGVGTHQEIEHTGRVTLVADTGTLSD